MDRWFLDRLIELGQLIAGIDERVKALEKRNNDEDAVVRGNADRKPAWVSIIVSTISLIVTIFSLYVAWHAVSLQQQQAPPAYTRRHAP